MILGHGIDIVDVDRIEKIYSKYGNHFLKKILSQEELQKINNTNKNIVCFLAKSFAIKEAVSKAIGCGLINGSPLHFNDIISSSNHMHKPIIKITKKMQNIIKLMHNLTNDDIDKMNIHLSTSDEKKIIIASAILELN